MTDIPTLAFLGPAGTFSHVAARRVLSVTSPDLRPLSTVPAVVDAVANGHFDYGLVPVENSVQGENATSIDALIRSPETLVIIEEVIIPIEFGAYVSPVWTRERPSKVVSHPNALFQCRKFTDSLGAQAIDAESTADACERVARLRDPYLVALAPESAAKEFGLQEYAADVGDERDSRTRFALLGRTPCAPTGNDVTSLVLTPPHTGSGSLVNMLAPFSEAGSSIRELIARPIRARLGEYCFFLTCSGHIHDGVTGPLLQRLIESGVFVRQLGSFAAIVNE